MSGDGTVGKSIVIRISGDGLKPEGGIDSNDRAMSGRHDREKFLQFLPMARAFHLQAYFFGTPARRRVRPLPDFPIADRLHKPLKPTLSAKHADHHICV